MRLAPGARFFTALVLLAPALASAVELGASAGVASIQQSGNASGLAADLRFGGTARAGEVEVTSELGGAFAKMGGAHYYGLLAGWRLRFGDLVKPGALVHLGLGNFRGEGFQPFTDAMWEVGGLVDVAPHQRVSFGVHVTYTGFFAGARKLTAPCLPEDPRCGGSHQAGSPTWLVFGLHAMVKL